MSGGAGSSDDAGAADVEEEAACTVEYSSAWGEVTTVNGDDDVDAVVGMLPIDEDAVDAHNSDETDAEDESAGDGEGYG